MEEGAQLGIEVLPGVKLHLRRRVNEETIISSKGNSNY
jgi:hypothetical protein